MISFTVQSGSGCVKCSESIDIKSCNCDLDKRSKEWVAVFIKLHKKNDAVSRVGSDFLLD